MDRQRQRFSYDCQVLDPLCNSIPNTPDCVKRGHPTVQSNNQPVPKSFQSWSTNFQESQKIQSSGNLTNASKMNVNSPIQSNSFMPCHSSQTKSFPPKETTLKVLQELTDELKTAMETKRCIQPYLSSDIDFLGIVLDKKIAVVDERLKSDRYSHDHMASVGSVRKSVTTQSLLQTSPSSSNSSPENYPPNVKQYSFAAENMNTRSFHDSSSRYMAKTNLNLASQRPHVGAPRNTSPQLAATPKTQRTVKTSIRMGTPSLIRSLSHGPEDRQRKSIEREAELKTTNSGEPTISNCSNRPARTMTQESSGHLKVLPLPPRRASATGVPQASPYSPRSVVPKVYRYSASPDFFPVSPSEDEPYQYINETNTHNSSDLFYMASHLSQESTVPAFKVMDTSTNFSRSSSCRNSTAKSSSNSVQTSGTLDIPSTPKSSRSEMFNTHIIDLNSDTKYRPPFKKEELERSISGHTSRRSSEQAPKQNNLLKESMTSEYNQCTTPTSPYMTSYLFETGDPPPKPLISPPVRKPKSSTDSNDVGIDSITPFLEYNPHLQRWQMKQSSSCSTGLSKAVPDVDKPSRHSTCMGNNGSSASGISTLSPSQTLLNRMHKRYRSFHASSPPSHSMGSPSNVDTTERSSSGATPSSDRVEHVNLKSNRFPPPLPPRSSSSLSSCSSSSAFTRVSSPGCSEPPVLPPRCSRSSRSIEPSSPSLVTSISFDDIIQEKYETEYKDDIVPYTDGCLEEDLVSHDHEIIPVICEWLTANGFHEYVDIFDNNEFPVDLERIRKHEAGHLSRNDLHILMGKLAVLNKVVIDINWSELDKTYEIENRSTSPASLSPQRRRGTKIGETCPLPDQSASTPPRELCSTSQVDKPTFLASVDPVVGSPHSNNSEYTSYSTPHSGSTASYRGRPIDRHQRRSSPTTTHSLHQTSPLVSWEIGSSADTGALAPHPQRSPLPPRRHLTHTSTPPRTNLSGINSNTTSTNTPSKALLQQHHDRLGFDNPGFDQFQTSKGSVGNRSSLDSQVPPHQLSALSRLEVSRKCRSTSLDPGGKISDSKPVIRADSSEAAPLSRKISASFDDSGFADQRESVGHVSSSNCTPGQASSSSPSAGGSGSFIDKSVHLFRSASFRLRSAALKFRRSDLKFRSLRRPSTHRSASASRQDSQQPFQGIHRFSGGSGSSRLSSKESSPSLIVSNPVVHLTPELRQNMERYKCRTISADDGVPDGSVDPLVIKSVVSSLQAPRSLSPHKMSPSLSRHLPPTGAEHDLSRTRPVAFKSTASTTISNTHRDVMSVRQHQRHPSDISDLSGCDFSTGHQQYIHNPRTNSYYVTAGDPYLLSSDNISHDSIDVGEGSRINFRTGSFTGKFTPSSASVTPRTNAKTTPQKRVARTSLMMSSASSTASAPSTRDTMRSGVGSSSSGSTSRPGSRPASRGAIEDLDPVLELLVSDMDSIDQYRTHIRPQRHSDIPSPSHFRPPSTPPVSQMDTISGVSTTTPHSQSSGSFHSSSSNPVSFNSAHLAHEVDLLQQLSEIDAFNLDQRIMDLIQLENSRRTSLVTADDDGDSNNNRSISTADEVASSTTTSNTLVSTRTLTPPQQQQQQQKQQKQMHHLSQQSSKPTTRRSHLTDPTMNLWTAPLSPQEETLTTATESNSVSTSSSAADLACMETPECAKKSINDDICSKEMTHISMNISTDTTETLVSSQIETQSGTKASDIDAPIVATKTQIVHRERFIEMPDFVDMRKVRASEPQRIRNHPFRWSSLARVQRPVIPKSQQISSTAQGFHSNEDIDLVHMSVVQMAVLKKMAMLRLTSIMEKQCPPNRNLFNWKLPKMLYNRNRNNSPDCGLPKEGNQVFGVSLSVWQRLYGRPMPPAMYNAMRYLKTNGAVAHGIFRRAGGKARIQALRQEIDNNPDWDSFDLWQPYDVADVLKQFFRTLSESLLTTKVSTTLINIFEHLPPDNRVEAMQLAILGLPDENRTALQCLLYFLTDLAAHADVTEMNASNLAVCLAPSLFYFPHALPTTGMSPKRIRRATGGPDPKDLADQKAAQQCLSAMITLSHTLFTVPGDTLARAHLITDCAEPPELSVLLHGRDWATWIQNQLVSLLKDCVASSSSTPSSGSKMWTAPSKEAHRLFYSYAPGVEVVFKKVAAANDAYPLRVWRCTLEIQATANEILDQIWTNRPSWDTEVESQESLESISDCTEVYRLELIEAPSQPSRHFLMLRGRQTNLEGGCCAILSQSVSHSAYATVQDNMGSGSDSSVTAHALVDNVFIEPVNKDKCKVYWISRVDIRGHSPEWYTTYWGHTLVRRLVNLRDFFLSTDFQPSSPAAVSPTTEFSEQNLAPGLTPTK